MTYRVDFTLSISTLAVGKENSMTKDYDDDYYYGPRSEVEEEPDSVSESIPDSTYDPVMAKFLNILTDRAERAVPEFDYIPKSISVAIVFSFPDRGVESVRLYSLNSENAHFLSKIAGAFSTSTIYLPRCKAS